MTWAKPNCQSFANKWHLCGHLQRGFQIAEADEGYWRFCITSNSHVHSVRPLSALPVYRMLAAAGWQGTVYVTFVNLILWCTWQEELGLKLFLCEPNTSCLQPMPASGRSAIPVVQWCQSVLQPWRDAEPRLGAEMLHLIYHLAWTLPKLFASLCEVLLSAATAWMSSNSNITLRPYLQMSCCFRFSNIIRHSILNKATLRI